MRAVQVFALVFSPKVPKGIGADSDVHMNAIFVLAIEHPHGLNGFGDGAAAANKDSINVKGKDEGVGHAAWGER